MGQHGVHMGPVGPILAPYGPHEPFYQGSLPSSMSYEVSIVDVLEKIDLVIMELHCATNTIIPYSVYSGC